VGAEKELEGNVAYRNRWEGKKEKERGKLLRPARLRSFFRGRGWEEGGGGKKNFFFPLKRGGNLNDLALFRFSDEKEVREGKERERGGGRADLKEGNAPTFPNSRRRNRKEWVRGKGRENIPSVAWRTAILRNLVMENFRKGEGGRRTNGGKKGTNIALLCWLPR